VQLGDKGFQAQAPYLEGLCIFRKGRFIAGFTNLSDPQRAANEASKLLGRVP
jgi:hypothetical protein